MATPPSCSKAARRYRLGHHHCARRWRTASLTGGLILTLLCAGCSQAPKPSTTSSPTPAAVIASASPSGEVGYAVLIEQYQAPVPETENGWPILKPLLVPPDETTPPLTERLESLDKPADLAYFDKEVLPKLKEAFAKPAFFDPHPLLSGRDPLNFHYRDLRRLCDLVAARADLLWSADKKGEALELLRLPLGLAKAMQSRPETVSVNLFSGPSYANASLRDIADWASDNSLKGAELDQAAKLLAEYRPEYKHIIETISVDFAQFESSLDDTDTRNETLGLAMAKPEDIELWKKQMRALSVDAKMLYGFEPGDADKFNKAVMKMAPQVQGLVSDYPAHSTQQKLAYATYLATELALGLERHRLSGEKKPLDAGKLLEQTFAADEEAKKAAAALLEYQPGESSGSFSLVGRGDAFKLAVPEGPTFYQRQGPAK